MEGTLAQVINFAGTFAPRNWMFCQGQIISISGNTALFALIGTTYGGNGRTNFALPDFRGRVAVGTGAGPGLNDYRLGYSGGTEAVALSINEMPTHNHVATTEVQASVNLPLSLNDAERAQPTSGDLPATASSTDIYAQADSNIVETPLAASVSGSSTIGNSGGSQAHSNMQPFLAMNYVICVEGVFPSRP